MLLLMKWPRVQKRVEQVLQNVVPIISVKKWMRGRLLLRLLSLANLQVFVISWSHGKYVANSGLIVVPDFRKYGLATKIKEKAFELSRKKFPDAKLFGLTTSAAVMKINSELGYRPAHYTELTDDETFWQGCASCVNYEILKSKDRKMCLCTAMVYDPEEKKKKKWDFITNSKLWERWQRIKNHKLLKAFGKGSKMMTFLGWV
jgi:hypothetical protein